MKNNYKFVSALALMLTLLFQQSFGQTVFTDNFNETPVTLTPNGTTTTSTPTMTYTSVVALGGGTTIPASSSIAGVVTAGFIQITNGSGGVVSGETYTTGTLSTYSSPFNPLTDNKLSSNTNLVQWTFNARTNHATTLTSFSAGNNYGMAIVLAADNADLTVANGYAVVYGASGFNNYRLVSFTGGLDANGNLTNIINSGANDFVNPNNYVSIRVTYNPYDNEWQLFSRDDGATAWADPSSGVNTQKGATTFNNVYTSTAMSVFGFYWKYGTTATQLAQFDNYTTSLLPIPPSLITATTSLAFGNQAVGTSSASQSFNISCAGLTGAPGNVTVNAPTNFQVSSDNISWGATAAIPYTTSTISSATVYVRFTPLSTGALSGNISFTGGGLGSSYNPTVALTGTAANSFNWTGATSNSWTVGTNWTPTGPPAANDAVTFNGFTVGVTNVPAIILNTLTVINGSVTLDNGAAGAATILSLSCTGTDTSNALNIASNGLLTIGGGAKKMSLTFTTAGNKATIAGTLNINGSVGTTSAFNAANSTTTVSGLLTDDDNGAITSTISNLIFTSSGTYQLLGLQAAVPFATWQTGSTCKISATGGGNFTPANLAQNFYNFTVDAPSLAAVVNCIGALATVNGDFSVLNTGTSVFRLAANQAYTLTIGGSLSISNGAQIDLSSTASSPVTQTINIGKNVSIGATGKFIRTATNGEAIINFNASNAKQTFNSPSTGVGSGINTGRILFNVGTLSTDTLQLLSSFIMNASDSLVVSNGATLICGANVIQATTAGTGGSFILNSGTNLFIGSAGGINAMGTNSGNIQTGALRTYNAGANYTYNGTVSQVTGNAVSTFNANLTINNTAATPTVTLSQSITASTNFYFTAGKLVMNGKTLTLNGNIIGTGTITGDAAATLNIGGTSGSIGTLYIDNSGGATNEFNNITMSRNGSTPSVTLGTDITVDGLLTLSSGIITTGANKVIVKSTAFNAIVTGGVNPANYTLSWVNGNLKRNFVTGSLNTYPFPVGSSSRSQLASIQSNGLTGPSYFTAYFQSPLVQTGNNINALLNATENSLGSSPYSHYSSVNPAGSWIIAPDVQPTGGNYNISLYYNGFGGLVSNQFGILKRPDTSTTYAAFITGGSLTPNGTADRLVLGGTGYALRSNIKSFSEFAIGQSAQVLPIQLVSFTAEKCDNNINSLLQWNTASELNNDHFDIESAASTLTDDGNLNFAKIGEVKGNGTSDVGHNYSFTDMEPNKSGTIYYRLNQVDVDGNGTYSNIQALSFNNGATPVVVLYPNPNEGQFAVNLTTALTQQANATLEVSNLLGQVIFSKVTALTNGSVSDNIALGGDITPGIYFMRVTVGSNVYVTKINIAK